MKNKKPAIEQIQEYLKKYNPLGMSGAVVTLVNQHNHLIYRLEKDGEIYCLRMINPESYRAGEWLHIAEEYTILKYLENTGLAPKAFYCDPERFSPALMIQEFIADATCFRELKPLSEKYLVGATEAIVLLNSCDITPEKFPFREGHTRYSYLTSVGTWCRRLADMKKSENKDVLRWAVQVEDVVSRAEQVLEKFEVLLQKAPFSLNFDGAHCGNTYWRDEKVIFLDWQKVSYGDPAFTLARFLTDTGESGAINQSDKEIMVKTYLERREIPNFAQLVDQRLFERQVADFIWVIWDYVRRKDTQPVEQATSVVKRYELVEQLL